MAFHKKKFQSHLSSRMTVYFSVMIILASVFLILFFSSRMIQNINKEAMDSMSSRLDNQSKMFQMFVTSYDQSSLNFRADDKFMNILLEDEPTYEELSYIEEELKYYLFMQKNIMYAKFYMPVSRTLMKISSQYILDGLEKDAELEDLMDAEYHEAGMNSGKYRYVFGDAEKEDTAIKNFSYSRIYIKIQDQSPLGILVIYFNQNFYEDVLEDNMDQDTLFSAIFDHENWPILMNSREYYDADREKIEELLNAETDENGYAMASEQGAIYMVKQLDGSKHISVISKVMVQKEIRITTLQSIAFLLLVICLFSLLIKILSDQITRPIIQLAEQMKEVNLDEQKPKLKVDREDEIGYLTVQFDQMLKNMNRLVQEKYVSKLNENEARMKALQAQINPHFLYNTLQVISTQAMISGNWKIVEMVDALSNTYRYSVKMGDIVTVSQEKVNLENYLSISKSRYEEQFEYQICIEERTCDFVIPKFTLQILAENAIKHGMGSGVLKLTIGVREEEQKIRIYAWDNGKGFKEEKREKLYLAIRQHQNDGSNCHGLGLKNLYDRFVNMYGEENVEIFCDTIHGETKVELEIVKNQVSSYEDIDN